VPWLARRWRPQALLPLAFLPPALAALVAGYAPSLAGLLVALAVAAASFQVLKVLTDALVGGATADAVRGRVFAVYDVLYNVAFVAAGLAMIPLWQPGKQRALAWGLAAAFAAGWLLLARLQRSWPFHAAGERRPPAARRWRLRGASALAGALPALAFPAPSLWWFAWLGLVPWLMLIRRAPTAGEAASRGWFGAVGFLGATHHWLVPNTGVFLLLAVALLAILWLPWAVAAWCLLSGRLTAGRLAAALLVVPAGWVAIEAVRSWSALGGPWALLGASQWNMPVMLASAAIGGAWLVGYLIVAANVAVVAMIAAPQARLRCLAAVGGLSVAAVGPAALLAQQPAADTGDLRVALVQPGVTHDPQRRFAAGEQLTRGLPAGGLDLVVWGESSVGFDLAEWSDLRSRLAALSRQLGADLLVNVDARDTTGAIHKTAVLVGPAGVEDRYEKMRLVPFGEYVPLRRALGWLALVTEAAGEDRARGAGLTTMHAEGLAFAPLICFESAFPDMSRRAANNGAEILVFQSSTSTFQDSWAPAQHASLAAVRAVETGRPAIHATLTGVSAAFDNSGHRLAWYDVRHRGTVTVLVPLAARTTGYLRYGDWVLAWSFTVLASAAAAATLASAPAVAGVSDHASRATLPGTPRSRPSPPR
jgi:apolipoprotein N-acyltransferase